MDDELEEYKKLLQLHRMIERETEVPSGIERITALYEEEIGKGPASLPDMMRSLEKRKEVYLEALRVLEKASQALDIVPTD